MKTVNEFIVCAFLGLMMLPLILLLAFGALIEAVLTEGPQ